MIKRKLVFFALVFLVLSVTFAPLSYGLFGLHKTCPRCGGTGRDPATLFLTSCPKCGGDGTIGIFMDDDDLEDTLSFIFVGFIIVVVIVGAVTSSKKE